MRCRIPITFMLLSFHFLSLPAYSVDLSQSRDGSTMVEDSLRYAMETSEAKAIYNSVNARMEVVASVPTKSHTEIVPVYSDNALTYILRVDEVSLRNPKMLMKDLGVLNGLITEGSAMFIPSASAPSFTNAFSVETKVSLSNLHGVAELIMNARIGSPTAKWQWNELQIMILKNISVNTYMETRYSMDNATLVEAREELIKENLALHTAAKEHLTKQTKKIEQWKKDSQIFENLESQELKLNDMVLNNDRAGVAKMLEAYLPWALMEPVEVNAWKGWLEAIRNPNKSPENTRVAFRGIDYKTDKIQRKITPAGEALGFMSTLLTKNQGSYTRRLRSLSTNREKIGDNFSISSNPLKSVKIMDQFATHSKGPTASSFLSFTYNPYIALDFVGNDIEKTKNGKTTYSPGGGMLVVRMDSRRLIPNITSKYLKELEMLAPLIIFPDEILKYHEGAFQNESDFKAFVESTAKEARIPFQQFDKTKTTPSKFVQIYTKQAYSFSQFVTEIRTSSVNSCGAVFMQ